MQLTIFTVGWLVVFSLNHKPWKGDVTVSKKWFIALAVCIILDLAFNV